MQSGKPSFQSMYIQKHSILLTNLTSDIKQPEIDLENNNKYIVCMDSKIEPLRNLPSQKRKKSKNTRHQNSYSIEPNPFSQDLAPWSQPQRLQSSINLLKAQQQSDLIEKFDQVIEQNDRFIIYPPKTTIKDLQRRSLSPEVNYNSLRSRKIPLHSTKYPKINSYDGQFQQQSKRTKQKNQINKRTKQIRQASKIASLTMQWDEQIIYNPQRKYLQEQNIKRKILKGFRSHRQTNSTSFKIQKLKEIKGSIKVIKGQFKNNKIHRKQQTIIEYKKQPLSQTLERASFTDDFKEQLSQLLVKVNKITTDKQSQANKKQFLRSTAHTHCEKRYEPDVGPSNISEHRKFRTSLKNRRVDLAKNKSKQQSAKCLKANKNRYEESSNERSQRQKQIINKLTLQYNNEKKTLPFHIMSKTMNLKSKNSLD